MGGNNTKSKLESLGFKNIQIDDDTFTTTSKIELVKKGPILYVKVDEHYVDSWNIRALVVTEYGRIRVDYAQLYTTIYTKKINKKTKTKAVVSLICDGKILKGHDFTKTVNLAPIRRKVI